MITCEQATGRICSCDNCNRVIPLILKYRFFDKKGPAFTELHLCEDCSCAMSNLHFKVMTSGVKHKYDMDEISEVSE